MKNSTDMRADAQIIIRKSIQAVLPDEAVRKALRAFHPGKGKNVLIAAGKAAWQMAKTALQECPDVNSGLVITKYGHVKGELPGVLCLEAGHPVPDENSFMAAEKALELIRPLGEKDQVLFLLSGGGSALLECPLIEGEELKHITDQLLASGADIVEINTIRKRLSAVKGGRFALEAAPARVFSIVLSDIPGDPLDMIASGPACPDSSTCEQARAVTRKYGLHLSEKARALLSVETPKVLDNVENHITGSVRELCRAAASVCQSLGYDPVILTDRLCCEAKEAGSFMAGILQSHAGDGKKLAFIAGGEPFVHVSGTGKGGRAQELSLAAAPQIAGLKNAALFSFGSDGTDGPTDAAGGYVDGSTFEALSLAGLDVYSVLRDNDAYTALSKVGGLIVTGPTGTNVNDVTVGLLGG